MDLFITKKQKPSADTNDNGTLSASTSNIITNTENPDVRDECSMLTSLTNITGPSRQRSLRDRFKDGLTGNFSWQRNQFVNRRNRFKGFIKKQC